MKSTMVIEAKDRKAGMNDGEMISALTHAKRGGFRIKKARVGFRGQIQELHFEKVSDETEE